MNLPVILKIAKYCQDKSDELNVEVLPTFVCNGTLLSPIVAEILQKNGILFGVSLDGDKETHDLYRKDKNGESTYSEIIHNVLQIKNREYIGCTGTLTNRVFDLKSSVVSLSKIFKTICFKPVRGKEYGFTEESEKAWKEKYDELSLYLAECINNNDPRIFYCLFQGCHARRKAKDHQPFRQFRLRLQEQYDDRLLQLSEREGEGHLQRPVFKCNLR